MRKKIIIDGKETNYSVTDDAHIYNDRTGRELKGTYATNEYHSVQLIIDGKSKTFMFHRLVAQAFCENPNGYTIVDHIDRDKHNDNASNLRWVCASTNSLNCEKQEPTKRKKYDGDFTEKPWVPVLGHPMYMVSNDGEVVSLKTNRYMVPQDRHGYKRVNMDGSLYSIHVVVWESFNNQKKESGIEIDHIDGNRSNNCLSNLRPVNHSENMSNSYNNGHQNQYKVAQYDLQGNYIQTFPTFRAAARELDTYECAIREAANRHGTSCGFYWIRENDSTTIGEIINEWVPEGFTICVDYPNYCINNEGQVYNKKTKKLTPIKYWADGSNPYIEIKGKHVFIKNLMP